MVSYLISRNPRERKQIRWKIGYRKIIHNIEKKYDVAISYVNGDGTYLVVDKVKADKKIAWVHNDYSAFNFNERAKKFDFEYFSKLDNIVSISDICVESLKKTFPDLHHKFVMLPNITSEKIIKEKAEEFFPKEFNSKRIKILSIGRLSHQKGFDLSIEAASILKNENIQFDWYIIGNGSDKKKLLKLVKLFKLKDTIHFIGVRDNPYPYIKNCDILAQTSRYEGKSMVIDEAKIIGVPILITNYASARDQIKSGNEGVIVEMNPVSIADGLKKLIKDKSFMNQLQKNLIKNKYSNENEIYNYYKLLDSKERKNDV